MNTELLTLCANWLEAGAPHIETKNGDIDGFNMSYYFSTMSSNYCGTACCIAGYILQVGGEGKETPGWDYAEGAERLLGISSEMGFELFDPEGRFDEYGDYGELLTPPVRNADITPDWAARTIRHLIATGEVDWLANAPVSA